MSAQNQKKIRYAVVGLGYISQAAMLPAFQNAENSTLQALISDDPLKLKKLSQKYKVPDVLSYAQYDNYLASGAVDAVYIALPNSLHRDFTVRAARRGVHVLCEKPMAVTIEDCKAMRDEAERSKVKLMIAYRLHFERGNRKVIEWIESGRLGSPRIFNSVFTMQVKKEDIRLRKDLGGGTLYDIGIYCINAARYLFRDEPYEVFAYSANNGESRFKEVDEMTAAILRFPEERLATFVTSFGSADVSDYRVVGTKGELTLEAGYEYAMPMTLHFSSDGKTKEIKFPKRDQFAPELIYFSDCILKDRQPRPSADEGLADIGIIQALYESAQKGRPVRLEFKDLETSGLVQDPVIERPGKSKPELVHASSPHGD